MKQVANTLELGDNMSIKTDRLQFSHNIKTFAKRICPDGSRCEAVLTGVFALTMFFVMGIALTSI